MQKSALISLWVLLGTQIVTACVNPYEPAGLSQTISEAQCEFGFECCDTAERPSMGRYLGVQDYADKEICIEENSKNSRVRFSILAEAQAEGRIEWDTAAAEECYSRLKTAVDECNFIDFLNVGCLTSDFVTGLVEENGNCYKDFECSTADSICQINTSDDEDTELMTIAGKCVSPLTEGQECLLSDLSCAREFFCNFRSDGRCEKYLTVGDDCSSGYCDAEISFCETDGTGSVCRSLKAIGEQCGQSAECLTRECGANGCMANSAVGLNPDTIFEVCTGNPLEN